MFAYFPALLLLLLQVTPGADWMVPEANREAAAWVYRIRQATTPPSAPAIAPLSEASRKNAKTASHADRPAGFQPIDEPGDTWPETPFVCAQRPRDGPEA